MPRVSNLDGRGGGSFMIICSTSSESQLLTVNMIMIIKHGHQLVAQIAMGAEWCRADIEAA
jgi:hypothetical protein